MRDQSIPPTWGIPMATTGLDSVEFDPADLFWSDGFSGGTALAHALGWGSYGVGTTARLLLFYVVRDLIVPELGCDVVVAFQPGPQNPVRAIGADGRLLRPLEAPGRLPLRASVDMAQIRLWAQLIGVPVPGSCPPRLGGSVPGRSSFATSDSLRAPSAAA
ncbi:MAG: hypothetical protein ACSLFN_15370 [Candidatus Limnocylindrales bacterium]